MNEVENTYNALSDKPLLVTSRWCKFGFHKWQKWSDPHETKGYSYKVIQKRFCNSCNCIQVKEIDSLATK